MLSDPSSSDRTKGRAEELRPSTDADPHANSWPGPIAAMRKEETKEPSIAQPADLERDAERTVVRSGVRVVRGETDGERVGKAVFEAAHYPYEGHDVRLVCRAGDLSELSIHRELRAERAEQDAAPHIEYRPEKSAKVKE